MSESPHVRFTGKSAFVNLATGESVHPPYSTISATALGDLHIKFTAVERHVVWWTMNDRAATRLRRMRRHALLVAHDGQPPKSRRRKRGGKRLL